MMRYNKKCEEFSICCEVGQEGVIVLEKSTERFTSYQIVVKVLEKWQRSLIQIIL